MGPCQGHAKFHEARGSSARVARQALSALFIKRSSRQPPRRAVEDSGALQKSAEPIGRFNPRKQGGVTMKKNSLHSVPNPFYKDIRKHGFVIDIQGDVMRREPTSGRPRRGEVRQPTAVRSIRLPKALWELVQAQARRERISINAALRQAAQIWIQS
jgi:hypothetical protein